MYLYQQQDHILYYLHPFNPALLTLALVGLSFLVAHPLLLAGLLTAVCLDLWSAGLAGPARTYLNIGLLMAGFIIIVNLLFNHHGTTIIYSLRVAEWGPINFTLEVLVFSLTMALRLLIMLEAFCWFTYLVKPDQMVKYLSRWGGNTALALAIVFRLLPGLVYKAESIRDIQTCRGLPQDTGGIRQKLKNSLPMIAALLGDSLDDSMQLAQSLQTRGFGIGKRVAYNNTFWSFQDTIFAGVVVSGLIVGSIMVVTGPGGFTFYPQLGPLFSQSTIYSLLVLMILFSYPAILSGGWRLWHYWKLTS